MTSCIERDCGVPQSDTEQILNFDLLEVVYEWAKGMVSNPQYMSKINHFNDKNQNIFSPNE